MKPDRRRAVEWECARLINQHAHLFNQRCWGELVNLYTADGVFLPPSDGAARIAGRGPLFEWFRQRNADEQYFCTNVVVHAEGTSAASAESLTFCATGAVAGLPLPVLAEGGEWTICYYRDRLVLTDDGWRFLERIAFAGFRPEDDHFADRRSA